MRRFLAVVAVGLFLEGAEAQQTPYVIPEELQRIAVELNVGKNMGIQWTEVADAGRYVGMLTAAAELSTQIAAQNMRTTPTREDYMSALTALCIWPPNKPPIVREYWPQIFPAFYDEKVRSSLKGVVGTAAFELPARISKTFLTTSTPSQFSYRELSLPADQRSYFTEVFDPRKLPGLPPKGK